MMTNYLMVETLDLEVGYFFITAKTWGMSYELYNKAALQTLCCRCCCYKLHFDSI